MPYAEISSWLGITVGSIGPHHGRCLDRLRRDPAIAALINADSSAASSAKMPVAADSRAGRAVADDFGEAPSLPHLADAAASTRQPGPHNDRPRDDPAGIDNLSGFDLRAAERFNRS